jgi:hypothetical protein
MAAIVAGIAVTGAFAQNVCDDLDGATAKYDAFTAGYNKNDKASLEAALAAGKEFLEKWGACESWAEQAKFVKGHVPRLEKMVGDMESYAKLKPFFDRFDAGIKADNTDEIYAAGKEILAINPSLHNVKYVMAVAGVLDASKALAAKTQSKYAAESLNHAKALYEQLKNGSLKLDRKIGDKESIGVLKWERPREEAISQLAYTIGYVNYYGLNNKKAALPSYYEVTQTAGFYKNYAPVFATISDYYRDEAENIGKEIVKLTTEYNALVDTVKKLPPGDASAAEATRLDGEIKAKDAQIKAKEALYNGYVERAMDALARAYKAAKDTTEPEKKYKAALYTDLQALYNRRFPNKAAGLNDWVTATTAKPLPDPSSTVEPISDEPVTTTTTGGASVGTGTGVGAANGTGIGAANGTGIGAANGTGVAAKAGTAAPKTATTAKAKPRR